MTRINGVEENRAERLKGLDKGSVVDLSTDSPEELAEKLQISSKITKRWVREARNLLPGKQVTTSRS